MRVTNTKRSYGLAAVLMHWAVAAFVFYMLYLGWTMTDLPLGPELIETYAFHKSIGVTIFALVVLRLGWKLANPQPRLPGGMPRWQVGASHASHFALYGLLLAMPVVGWLYSSASGFPVSVYGLFTLPDLVGESEALADTLQTAHWLGGIALAALVVLHVAAAFKHHFVDGDVVLMRMFIPGAGEDAPELKGERTKATPAE